MTDRVAVRNAKPISRGDREAIRDHHGLTDFLEYHDLDGWQQCDVRPQALRVVHGDFRHEPLVKGRLFADYLAEVKDRIDNGDFPYAADIRKPWPDKPPVYVLRTRCNGELYVYDGEKRTLNACYHDDPWMPALLVEVDEEREVL